jgi:hypothetical protein
VHRAQSGPFRVRIEARQRGWRQYNLGVDCLLPVETGTDGEKYRRRLRRNLLHEFSKASAIYRPVGTFTPGTKRLFAPSPAPHRLDESQPVIPWRVALLHYPPPLHQLSSECYTAIMTAERFTPNDGTVACSNVRCRARTAAASALTF